MEELEKRGIPNCSPGTQCWRMKQAIDHALRTRDVEAEVEKRARKCPVGSKCNVRMTRSEAEVMLEKHGICYDCKILEEREVEKRGKKCDAECQRLRNQGIFHLKRDVEAEVEKRARKCRPGSKCHVRMTRSEEKKYNIIPHIP